MPIKKIAILGSTGSIGKSTLQVIDNIKNFQVHSLAANSNIGLLEQQILKYRPSKVVVFDSKAAVDLQKKIPNFNILTGLDGLKEIATDNDVDFVMLAMTGIKALIPAIEAIKSKKQIAIANKELLVAAGQLISKLALENNVLLRPVDSEHSALFQCLNGEKKSKISRLILTASGGPFRTYSTDQLKSITIEQALLHPNWKMGPKITVDSSTLMNKGLEVIEAHWLFNVPVDKIDVVIHPQSIVHSMVEYLDGSILSQMSPPSMLLPIQYALSYPDRYEHHFEKLNFNKNLNLEFFPVDFKKFPCLELAFFALNKKQSYPCYLNAANETLVKKFLDKEIAWTDIFIKLKKLITSHKPYDMVTLDAVLNVDQLAREDASAI
jgi:1-deoxy-D-xylulose-5-phosphate reductoisomerase